eukprot:CAMPEP_0182563916 /NCGR_PEP_ID=MMETSP1324-20130603/5967_1 /TAXON_ID=236786 /ORGANISM="Florenciella sp., Strain RCC1587" /LENGTH=57 /DNA_ID=CAMNT_0024777247 /DNA_START=21 /DNA_END=194 /DNA_ORIENTATION=+
MAAGGGRDGGWMMFAKLYGNDDGVMDIAGGPNIAGQQALPSGKKPRRRRGSTAHRRK